MRRRTRLDRGLQKFPAPWHVDETENGQYVVRDANGLALAHICAGNLTSAEALTIARAIAELPAIPEARQPRAFYVVPHKQGGWAIRREGAIRATSIYRTIEQAKRAAQLLAQKEGGAQGDPLNRIVISESRKDDQKE
jgi:Uncharacterized protein conserved in bacteria (DUF2188)